MDITTEKSKNTNNSLIREAKMCLIVMNARLFVDAYLHLAVPCCVAAHGQSDCSEEEEMESRSVGGAQRV